MEFTCRHFTVSKAQESGFARCVQLEWNVPFSSETRGQHRSGWHHQTHDPWPGVWGRLSSGERLIVFLTHLLVAFLAHSCSVLTPTLFFWFHSCSRWSGRSSPTSTTSPSSSQWWAATCPQWKGLCGAEIISDCWLLWSPGAFPAVPRHVPEGQREGGGLQVHNGGLH